MQEHCAEGCEVIVRAHKSSKKSLSRISVVDLWHETPQMRFLSMYTDSTRGEVPGTTSQTYPIFSDQERFLTCEEYSSMFRRGLSSLNPDLIKGVGAPFIKSGLKVLYPLSLAVRYHSSTGSVEKMSPVVLVQKDEDKRANVARKAAA